LKFRMNVSQSGEAVIGGGLTGGIGGILSSAVSDVVKSVGQALQTSARGG
jgi:hypothetical protein